MHYRTQRLWYCFCWTHRRTISHVRFITCVLHILRYFWKYCTVKNRAYVFWTSRHFIRQCIQSSQLNVQRFFNWKFASPKMDRHLAHTHYFTILASMFLRTEIYEVHCKRHHECDIAWNTKKLSTIKKLNLSRLFGKTMARKKGQMSLSGNLHLMHMTDVDRLWLFLQ